MPPTRELVDLRGWPETDLLTRVYDSLYLPSFTLPDERESLAQYQERLWGPRCTQPPETHFLVCGQALRDPERRVLEGFIVAELYPESRCGLVTFLAVSPALRRAGVGRAMMAEAQAVLAQAAAPWGGLLALFAESHRPECVDPEQEPMDPIARLRALGRLGGAVVPIPYVQPALAPDAARSHRLLLLCLPRSGCQPPETLPRTVLMAFLHEFYRALGVRDPDKDADFGAMQQQQPPEAAARWSRYPLPQVALT